MEVDKLSMGSQNEIEVSFAELAIGVFFSGPNTDRFPLGQVHPSVGYAPASVGEPAPLSPFYDYQSITAALVEKATT